jgi:hypothetical protein
MHNRVLFSHKKRMKNEIMLVAGKWMELEHFMLSEVSQVQKIKDCMFSLYVESRPIS